jgi:hypothetical protein
MKFIVHYKVAPEHRDAAQRRFKETGGGPPAGVTMIERYHCAQGLEGFVICESNDAAAMAKWTQSWTDHLRFRILPVIDDQAFAKLLG